MTARPRLRELVAMGERMRRPTTTCRLAQEVLRLRAALRPAIRIAEAAIEIADNLGEPATNQRQALDEMRIALAESEKEWPE